MNDTTALDLTVAAARSQRDGFASRVDVLDKVGALRTLPDDMHVTTDMVAEFYEVDRETILTVVKRNRDEIEGDGYRVVTKGVFEETFKLNVSSRSARVALFPRRAVLRVGMLLRDSVVARKVRDYLLDSEQTVRAMPVEPLSGLEYALALVNAEQRVLEEKRRADAGEKFKRAIEGGDGLGLREFHKKYFSSVTETEFMEHLYSKHYLIDQRGKGTLRESGPRAGTYRDGSQHRHPSYKGKEFFYLHANRDRAGGRRENTRVRPGRWEIALRDRLAAEGLTANENTSGLFVIEGGQLRGELA
ncbi:hypothetical protein GV791_14645 [Nocardia cyriacigeorgica]|uniref:Antirepressor protein C-terminal domain-containing protein n=1 Tax=Nocardia cyriacigeorgica TaxID=135487 RepID=A0A6P1CQZ2_9NOCA|nr:hypothetical protein [Nocardia cyriacigeorgica]NEW33794.1 hypothetical protein [Nocardia cyriacigeorgica]